MHSYSPELENAKETSRREQESAAPGSGREPRWRNCTLFTLQMPCPSPGSWFTAFSCSCFLFSLFFFVMLLEFSLSRWVLRHSFENPAFPAVWHFGSRTICPVHLSQTPETLKLKISFWTDNSLYGGCPHQQGKNLEEKKNSLTFAIYVKGKINIC